MPENNKENTQLSRPADVQQKSVIKDLAKYAMDEYIKPKTDDVLHDLFAGIVDMFGDAIRGVIDKHFYGEARPSSNNNNKVKTFSQNSQNVPYNTYSMSANQSYSKPKRVNNSHRPGYDVNYTWVWTREDADKVVSNLREEIDNYGYTKVGVFYEQIKQSTTPDDWKYGWGKVDKDSISYYEDRGRRQDEARWFIALPPAKPLSEIM